MNEHFHGLARSDEKPEPSQRDRVAPYHRLEVGRLAAVGAIMERRICLSNAPARRADLAQIPLDFRRRLWHYILVQGGYLFT